MPYGAIFSFFSNWRNIVILALAAACIGMFIHGLAQRSEIVSLKDTIAVQKGELADAAKVVEQLKTDVAQRDFDIGNLNTKLNLSEASISQQNNGIAALQAQVKKLQDDSAYWWNMSKKKDKIINGLKSTEAAEMVKKGMVIDEKSSVQVIESINATVFGGGAGGRPAGPPGGV
jgi:septal ring factor EnvC (AmiA/AmiB activator)